MDRSTTTAQHSGGGSQALSLRQIRFFASLAELGSFSRAAERMAVSQPALSAAIRQVETHLGFALFERTTHRVALTEAGRALLPHALRLLTTADNAFVDMNEAATRQRATVRVGAIPSAVPTVAQVLARIPGEADTLSVHVSDGKSDLLLDQLRTGALDLVVCAAPPGDASFEETLLFEDEMLLVVPRDHRLADAAKLAWSELHDSEIVHFSGGSIGELTSAAMRQNNLSPSRKYRVDQADSLFGLVRAGLAVGVMPRLYTQGLGWDRLRLVPLRRPTIKRRLVLLQRKALGREHPAAAGFCRILADRLREAFHA